MNRRTLSLGALTVLELDPPGMVSCAAAAGYQAFGLRILPSMPDEPVWPSAGDTPMVREIARRIADTGVRLLDIEIFRIVPDTDVRAFLPALETGARLGATEALLANYDPDQARFADKLAALCDLCAPLGIAVNLEPMPWTQAPDLAAAARLVEAAGRPNAAILVDALHFDRGGNVPADLAGLARRRFRYMQLCDAPAARPRDTEALLHQARCERLMPGDGGLDLTGLLRALPADIPIALEVPMRELAQSVSAVERTRRMRMKAEALLASLDA
jgi:sugar phosphate isomerase/epimerase